MTFLAGNGETAALAAWKGLKAQGAPNLYVIEGGMNGWLEKYAVPACVAEPAAPASGAVVGTSATTSPDAAEAPRFRFAYATGASLPAAWPELPHSRAFRSPCEAVVSGGAGGHEGTTWPAYAFAKKVKLQSKAAVKGGCG